MKADIEAHTLTDPEEDERYGYDFDWSRNRAILKQLVKDNIDISMLKDEMSSTLQQRGRKTWRQYLLTILRSHMMQIILSLLVLLDAGIVITEIVLEIQSLQSYKNNFRQRLHDIRQILCTIVEINTPNGQPHPSCSLPWPSEDSNSTKHYGFPRMFHATDGKLQHDKEESVEAFGQSGTGSGYFHPQQSDTHGSPDAELLQSVTSLINYWESVYSNHQFHCAMRSNSEAPGLTMQDFQASLFGSEARTQLNHTPSKSGVTLRRTRKYGTIILRHQRNGTRLQTFSEIHRQPSKYTTTTTPNIALSEVQIDRSGEEHIFAHDPLSFTHGTSVDNSAQMMHEASEVLHYLSIAITGLFLICVIIKIICLKRKFLRDTNEYFDAGIIMASFASDVLYVRYASETAAAMVVFLLWRIIRIINALMMHKQQQYELRIAMQKRARRLLGRKMEIIRTEKEMQDKHIGALEDLLRELGASTEVIRRCKPRYKKCTKEQTNNALKSIAALTTGVMGGLVGAPSNFQGVISKYGGTAFNTPTASQKSLQGMIGSSVHNLNVYTRRSSQVKGVFPLPEQNFNDQFCGNIAKSVSSTFELQRCAPNHNTAHIDCRSSLENSLNRKARISLCNNSIDDGSCECEIPLPDDNLILSTLRESNSGNVILGTQSALITNQVSPAHTIERNQSFPQVNFQQPVSICPLEPCTPEEPTSAVSTHFMIKHLSYSKHPFQWNRIRRKGKTWKATEDDQDTSRMEVPEDMEDSKTNSKKKIQGPPFARKYACKCGFLQASEPSKPSPTKRALIQKQHSLDWHRGNTWRRSQQSKTSTKCTAGDLQNVVTGFEDTTNLSVSVSYPVSANNQLVSDVSTQFEGGSTNRGCKIAIREDI
ncbi:hypothetical protein CRM22_005057 [Opisthorchis felineus]|uniref:Voltage-gated hydrogen channel 1 n=1 Tax=Opisthorchis felineus TaxID=147828 RepID=A0A4S2LT45_OPIFE|nr:hypothetical protein CRM22_005057 [Opisthorchis felineus]